MDKKRILIIDDEKEFLDMVEIGIARTGKYEVIALLSAKEILSQVQRINPDLIVVDLLMPSIGGIEVCEILNDDASTKNIPIIVLSALDKEVDKLKAYKQGVVDYLVKPISVDTLVAKIEKALEYKSI
ncbi:MAG: response regulator [Candidatus Omnitrophota bacterium]|nr:MAG: response regulator [Candidatus Omnitrophota bacterium]